jgi:hypothetical protein
VVMTRSDVVAAPADAEADRLDGGMSIFVVFCDTAPSNEETKHIAMGLYCTFKLSRRAWQACRPIMYMHGSC